MQNSEASRVLFKGLPKVLFVLFWARENGLWTDESITCEGGHVTGIILSGLCLRGVVSPTIGHLHNLTVIDLSKNNLFGAIPSRLVN